MVNVNAVSLFYCITFVVVYCIICYIISFDDEIILVDNDEKLKFQKIYQNKFIYSGIFFNKL
jgi:hypothetical protein